MWNKGGLSARKSGFSTFIHHSMGLVLKGDPGVNAQCSQHCRANAFISDTLNGGVGWGITTLSIYTLI